jgi:hypothetical protein
MAHRGPLFYVHASLNLDSWRAAVDELDCSKKASTWDLHPVAPEPSPEPSAPSPSYPIYSFGYIRPHRRLPAVSTQRSDEARVPLEFHRPLHCFCDRFYFAGINRASWPSACGLRDAAAAPTCGGETMQQ